MNSRNKSNKKCKNMFNIVKNTCIYFIIRYNDNDVFARNLYINIPTT